MEVVERLDAEMITRKEQDRIIGAQIADREGEHSVQSLDAIRPLLFVEMDDHFGVSV